MNAGTDSPERRSDPETRRRLSELMLNGERTARRIWIAMIVLYIGAALSVFAMWQLYRGAQRSRLENIHRACMQSNDNHASTKAALDAHLDAAERADPARAGEIAAQRATALLLLDGLSPVRSDCDAYARTQVR